MRRARRPGLAGARRGRAQTSDEPSNPPGHADASRGAGRDLWRRACAPFGSRRGAATRHDVDWRHLFPDPTMIPIVLAASAFVLCLLAASRSLKAGICGVIAVGYAYGITRANFATTY